MSFGSEVLSRDMREVFDVLGEQRAISLDGSGEDIGIGFSGQPKFDHCGGGDIDSIKRLGQSGRVHLVQQ